MGRDEVNDILRDPDLSVGSGLKGGTIIRASFYSGNDQ